MESYLEVLKENLVCIKKTLKEKNRIYRTNLEDEICNCIIDNGYGFHPKLIALETELEYQIEIITELVQKL